MDKAFNQSVIYENSYIDMRISICIDDVTSKLELLIVDENKIFSLCISEIPALDKRKITYDRTNCSYRTNDLCQMNLIFNWAVKSKFIDMNDHNLMHTIEQNIRANKQGSTDRFELKGLPNVGASCWLNSTINFLATTHAFDELWQIPVANNAHHNSHELLEIQNALHKSISAMRAGKQLDAAECKNLGLDHLFGYHSVKREFPAGLICDESIALAMVEEKSGSDGDSQLTEC